MTAERESSWGRWPRHRHEVRGLWNRFDRPSFEDTRSFLPWGNGRSYGDSCQNDNGVLLATRGLDRFIAFDARSGVLECEAGVTLAEIIDQVLPTGWFVPITPGTCLVTVGGAIANDVHGKNHHRMGSFGCQVLGFELMRSDGTVLHCSRAENADWFGATIGGLGLTGLIRRVKLQLRSVPGPFLYGQSLRFANLQEFFALSNASDADYEYTVSWLDCSAGGKGLGRGIFMRGNHAPVSGMSPKARPLSVPFTPPISLINRWSLAGFNRAYYHRPSAHSEDAIWHYRPFFYPLDGIRNWNRIYGPRGFFQYQCVVPDTYAQDSLTEMLAAISRSGSGSFLAVLKIFGRVLSPGWMSFPRPGATLALDFPNGGASTLKLLDRLDQITLSAGGAVYPAKDARMSGRAFKQYFPRWQEFAERVDPRFSSSFWRRVTGVDS